MGAFVVKRSWCYIENCNFYKGLHLYLTKMRVLRCILRFLLTKVTYFSFLYKIILRDLHNFISHTFKTLYVPMQGSTKCKNNGGPYGFAKLEVRGRTWYSTNPRTPFPPISLSCVHRIWLKSYVIHSHQHHSLIVHIAITYAQS